MQKIIAFLAAVLVLAAGAYFFVPSAPVSESRIFESTHLGLKFEYPSSYEATSTHMGNAERGWHAVVLLPAGYTPPQGGEGPPAITVQDIPNPEGLALEAWILGDARSNWKLAAQDGGLGSTTVGGEPALSYKHSGLYETSAVAVAHGDKIYLFEAGWLTPEDKIRTDFEKLLDTVQFIDGH